MHQTPEEREGEREEGRTGGRAGGRKNGREKEWDWIKEKGRKAGSVVLVNYNFN